MIHFPDQYPGELTPDDLPEGAHKRRIRQIFDERIFTGGNFPGPTVERILSLGARTPPSLVELSISTAAIYRGVRQKCVLSAQNSQHLADSYELDPREVANPLVHIDWTCAGFLDNTTFPAISFVARLSTSLGPKLVTPREIWLQEDPYFRPVLYWDAFLPVRTHIPASDLIWDLRTYASNPESLSFWILGRPMALVGPGARLATAVLDCFLLTLTTVWASANAFGLSMISGAAFFEGLAALSGVVSIAQSESGRTDRSVSETETRSPNRDGGPGNAPFPTDLIAPSSSSDCEAE